MKYTFVEARKTGYPVAKQCAWLSVSRAGYYAWRKRTPSARAKQDERLGVLVSEAHMRSRRTYGSPRVHAEVTTIYASCYTSSAITDFVH